MLYFKDPQARLDYLFDWTAWLGDDTITSSTMTADPGLNVSDSSRTAKTTTVWLSGGTVDVEYQVTNHIVTAAGRENDKTITINVQER